MQRTAEHVAESTVQRSEAWAFDRKRHNRRPAFALQQSLQRLPDGKWQSRREWCGVGTDLVARETILWHSGLLESIGEQPSIEETTRASMADGRCRCSLRSPKTGAAERMKVLSLPHPAVTLASLPLFIAQHWAALLQGASVPASYLVLKVQRAATVDLHRVVAAGSDEVAIDATPTHLLLRWIFGSTRCVFDADAPRLRRVEGLLDPRDFKSNGRWHEYLGTVEFQQALDFSGIANAGDSP